MYKCIIWRLPYSYHDFVCKSVCNLAMDYEIPETLVVLFRSTGHICSGVVAYAAIYH